MFWADAKSTISYFLGPTFLGPIKLTQQRAVNMFKNMFKEAKNIISEKPRANLCRANFSNIFYTPEVANLRFWRIGPTMAL